LKFLTFRATQKQKNTIILFKKKHSAFFSKKLRLFSKKTPPFFQKNSAFFQEKLHLFFKKTPPFFQKCRYSAGEMVKKIAVAKAKKAPSLKQKKRRRQNKKSAVAKAKKAPWLKKKSPSLK